MKTAVSIPDEVFRRAEELARRRRLSRSRLISTALEEYLQRHEHEDVTAELDRVYSQHGSAVDAAAYALQHASLTREKW